MSQPSFDFGVDGDGTPFGQPDGTLTVGELTEAINRTLRGGFAEGVWVRGEIQGWNARGPHAYFTLADDETETKAVVPVAFFAPQRDRLRPLLSKHRLALGDGMKVRVFGYLDYYAPTGRLSLKMSGIDPRFTLGDLAQQRDQTLRRLLAAGLLDANRRHRLASPPLRVGVVTSVGSAAWHDFVHELERSGVGFELRVCDVRVQGDRAVPMVSAAVHALGRQVLDVIVVIRGGGARNELAVFDAEPIALAIANAPVPVFTGLGHEVDRSVADEVAHTSYKTPTACAAALVAAAIEYRTRADAAYRDLVAAARRDVASAEQRLAERAHRIARRTGAAVVRADELLSARRHRLGTAADRALGVATRRVDADAAVLVARAPRVADAAARQIDRFDAHLRLVDPQRMLAKGWTITRTASGASLSAATVAIGESLVTHTADGRITSIVTAATSRPGAVPAAVGAAPVAVGTAAAVVHAASAVLDTATATAETTPGSDVSPDLAETEHHDE